MGVGGWGGEQLVMQSDRDIMWGFPTRLDVLVNSSGGTALLAADELDIQSLWCR